MTTSIYPLLTLGLALTISWALFAILCSLLHEAFVQVKAERGRFLKKYLLQQLDDQPNGINWGLLLYTHGSIELLSRAPEKPTNCISGELFAQSIIAVVGNSLTVNTAEAITRFRNPLIDRFSKTVQSLRPSNVQALLLQALQNASAQSTDQNGIIDEALLYTDLSGYLENWYNQLMGRVSLWYEKKTRQRLFSLGLVLALLINVDSIELFGLYRQHPASAKAVIQYYQDHESYLHGLIQADSAKKDSASLLIQQKAIALEKFYADSLKMVTENIDLPVGIDKGIFGSEAGHSSLLLREQALPAQQNTAESKSWIRSIAHWLLMALLKLTGCLISGFAASFGAPFWFNLFRKLISWKKRQI